MFREVKSNALLRRSASSTRCLLPTFVARMMRGRLHHGPSRVALLIGVALFGGSCTSPHTLNCNAAEGIANDPARRAYLNEWIQSQLSSGDFPSIEGPYVEVMARDSPQRFAKLGLDTDFLGIDARYGFVRFYENSAFGAEESRPSSVSGVAVGQGGRSGVLFVLDSSDALLLRRVADESDLRKFADDVYVFCR